MKNKKVGPYTLAQYYCILVVVTTLLVLATAYITKYYGN